MRYVVFALAAVAVNVLLYRGRFWERD